VTAEGLGGLRIGVERSTTSEAYLDSHFADASHIVGLGRQIDINQALIDGRADLIVGDPIALWKFLKGAAGQGYAAVGAPIQVDEGIGIAVRAADDGLRRRLNLAIARLRLDGTYEKINARYFPFSIY
jgi:ABC-type amino acid transport substrate-binding protein